MLAVSLATYFNLFLLLSIGLFLLTIPYKN